MIYFFYGFVILKNIFRYRQNIKEAVKLSLDQPMTNLQRAVWWTEYVLRRRSTKHLHGTAVHMPFYKYYLLDVVGFTLAVLIIISYSLINVLLYVSCKLYKLRNIHCKLKQT